MGGMMTISTAARYLGLLALSVASAGAYEATAILKLESAKGAQVEEIRAFLDQVKSRPALDEIAARLALGQTWKLDRDQTAGKLAGMLEVSVNGNNGKITADEASPQMAAILANVAASVLKDSGSKAVDRPLESLNEAVREQKDTVAQKRATLAKIIREQGVIFEDGAQPAPVELDALSAQLFVDAKNDFETAQQLLVQLEAKAEKEKSGGAIRVHHVIWAKAPEE